MEFLLFSAILLLAILTGWLYTTIDQKERMTWMTTCEIDEPCPYCDEEPCICDYLYESRRDIEFDGF